jgi:hypothetical protein
MPMVPLCLLKTDKEETMTIDDNNVDPTLRERVGVCREAARRVSGAKIGVVKLFCDIILHNQDTSIIGPPGWPDEYWSRDSVNTEILLQAVVEATVLD